MPESSVKMSGRVLFAAAFSSAYCVLISSLYFSVYFGVRSGEYGLVHLWGIFPNVLRQVSVPAAGFGFILGGIGALILSGFTFLHGRIQKTAAAGIVGGVLGCLPPSSWPPPQEFETPLSLLPCVLIGSSCAIAWLLISLRQRLPMKA